MILVDINQSLKTLIRVNTKHDVLDAMRLAKKVLAPFQSEMDREGNKFSTELLRIAVLYVAYEQPKPTLKSTLELLANQKIGTDREAVVAIAKDVRYIPGRGQGASCFKDFDTTASNLSNGMAEQKVSRSLAQWRQAFGLPEIEARNIKSAMAFPIRDSIRIGTRYELGDAIALAKAVLSPIKGETDNITFEWARDLFIAAALDVAHTTKSHPTMQHLVNLLVDPGWDNHRQITTQLGNPTDVRKQGKTGRWLSLWFANVGGLSLPRTKYLIDRSHAVWVSAFKVITEGKSSARAAKLLAQQSGIQVFNPDAIEKAMLMVSSLADGKKSFGESVLQIARTNNGYRELPDSKNAGVILEKAKSQFENLIDPISHLQTNLALAAASKPGSFSVTPILLLGDTGVGKTFLAMTLAKSLGGTMQKLCAGGAQGGFQLNGSNSSWSTARCGTVFQCLAEGKTTSPIFIVDEIDKIRDAQYPITPVLLSLFEPGTAKTFKDEFYEMEFDASRIIVILTANSIDDVPAPLLSRVEVFTVPRPEPIQRLRIIQNTFKELRAVTGKKIRLDTATSQQLADRTDIDLRKTTRVVRESFTKAMLANEPVARLVISEKENKVRKVSIGFHPHTDRIFG